MITYHDIMKKEGQIAQNLCKLIYNNVKKQ